MGNLGEREKHRNCNVVSGSFIMSCHTTMPMLNIELIAEVLGRLACRDVSEGLLKQKTCRGHGHTPAPRIFTQKTYGAGVVQDLPGKLVASFLPWDTLGALDPYTSLYIYIYSTYIFTHLFVICGYTI